MTISLAVQKAFRATNRTSVSQNDYVTISGDELPKTLPYISTDAHKKARVALGRWS